MASRTGPAIADTEPLVSDLGRAAMLLAVDERELGAVIGRAGLQPWGQHASGQPVYSWGALVEVAVAAGLEVNMRWGRHAWRRRPMVGKAGAP
jgi:hypothetical protein